MNAKTTTTMACALACALGIAPAGPAAAQAYPTKPLRFVIPFPPGGGADGLARVLAERVVAGLGQQLVIDNRAGAAGNIAAEIVAHAAPDGYTLLQGNISHTISVSLYDKLQYDLMKDLTPVSRLANTPFMLVVNPSVPAQSVTDLVALAKSRPNALTYGSSGFGGPSHMAMELFKNVTGTQIRHVPYKGGAPAVRAVVANEVQLLFATLTAGRALVANGRMRNLGVASARRLAAAPELQTVSESGLPGFEAGTWFGLMVPAGTPKAVIDRLYTEFSKVLQMPDVRARLEKQAFDIVASPPDVFAKFVRDEVEKWGKVVREANLKQGGGR